MFSRRVLAASVLTAVLVGLAAAALVFRAGDVPPEVSAPPPANQAPRADSPATPTPVTATITATAVATITPLPTATAVASVPIVEPEPQLALILPEPRGVLFRELGESVALEVSGLYSDGSERALPDQPGRVVVFSSSDPSVVDVDAQGRITPLAPGGADIHVQYGGVRAEVPVIVYGPYVQVPPYNPQDVVEVAPGVEIIVRAVPTLSDPNQTALSPGVYKLRSPSSRVPPLIVSIPVSDRTIAWTGVMVDVSGLYASITPDTPIEA